MTQEVVDFTSLWQVARHWSVLGEEKCRSLFSIAASVRGLPGTAVELGTWRGGSAWLLRKALGRNKTLLTVDTLTGMPAAYYTEGLDMHVPGEWADCSMDTIMELFRPANIELVIGTYPDQVQERLEKPDCAQLCLAHYDLDTYIPCQKFLRWAWPRIVPGGVIVLDDYGWAKCPGVQLAATEFDFGEGSVMVRPTDKQAAIFKSTTAKWPPLPISGAEDPGKQP